MDEHFILSDIPETIQSAQKLLEIAKNVNSSLDSFGVKKDIIEKPDFSQTLDSIKAKALMTSRINTRYENNNLLNNEFSPCNDPVFLLSNFNSERDAYSVQSQEDSLSHDTYGKKRKIAAIGNKLREDLKFIEDLKNEIYELPNSRKDQITSNNIYSSTKAAETLANNPYTSYDERKIRPSIEYSQEIKKPMERNICICSLEDSAISANTNKNETLRDSKLNNRIAEVNISRSSCNNISISSSKNPEQSSERQKNFLRKRSNLKYDPMESARLAKIEKCNSKKSNSVNKSNDSKIDGLNDFSDSAIMMGIANCINNATQIINQDLDIKDESFQKYDKKVLKGKYLSNTKMPSIILQNDNLLTVQKKNGVNISNTNDRKLSLNVNKNNMNTDLHQNLLSQPNSSLLPIHEFEKINENFRKFKDKKKNLKDSQEIHDPKSRQKKNLLTVRSSNNSKFGDATSEITVNASIDVAAERSIQNNMSKISVDYIPGNAEASNFSQSCINYKNNLEDRSQDIKESENVEEDEVNIISIDEESCNGIKGKMSPSQSKKLGKYRRNRNMRQVKLTLN